MATEFEHHTIFEAAGTQCTYGSGPLDGLRSVAVLGVLAFHAQFSSSSGAAATAWTPFSCSADF